MPAKAVVRARRAGRSARWVLVVVVVLLAHGVAVRWLDDALVGWGAGDKPGTERIEVAFVRALAPSAAPPPAPTAAARKAAKARAPRAAASAPAETQASAPVVAASEPVPDEVPRPVAQAEAASLGQRSVMLGRLRRRENQSRIVGDIRVIALAVVEDAAAAHVSVTLDLIGAIVAVVAGQIRQHPHAI